MLVGVMVAAGSSATADVDQHVVADSGEGDVAQVVAESLGALSRMAESMSPRPPLRATPNNAQWGWPLPGPEVALRLFDGPSKPWLPGHRGVDLAGFEGSNVTSVADGVVSYRGAINGVGIVSVHHPNGLLSTYQPVSDAPGRGSTVRRGERIGTLGSQGSHCWPLSCLHLGARIAKNYIDPMLLLQRWEVSLLPGR
ncbi:MAG: M23 family metallopeptidase [Ornithinimicrobium sp.]